MMADITSRLGQVTKQQYLNWAIGGVK